MFKKSIYFGKFGSYGTTITLEAPKSAKEAEKIMSAIKVESHGEGDFISSLSIYALSPKAIDDLISGLVELKSLL